MRIAYHALEREQLASLLYTQMSPSQQRVVIWYECVWFLAWANASQTLLALRWGELPVDRP
jgi:hypothetical protein